MIGFSKGVYPSINTINSYNVLSNITPNATTVNSIVICSNIVNNACCIPSDILDCFSMNNTYFGKNIVYTPCYKKLDNGKRGIFQSFTAVLQDQHFYRIQ